MTEPIQQAATLLAGGKKVIALTGAGISVESGIPPFRGKGGLWEKYDPMKYAHIDAFERNPDQVWRVLFMDLKNVLKNAEPNDGHKGLNRLEKMGRLQTIITQNIDGLHQRAGNSDVIEFHGTFATQRCMDCAQPIKPDHLDLSQLPPKCACGGVIRPDVIMFGEPIDFNFLQRSQLLAASCDVMLVIGTSATVEPASHLPLIAKRGGARIIEINADQTPLTRTVSDIALIGEAGPIMKKIVAKLEKIQ